MIGGAAMIHGHLTIADHVIIAGEHGGHALDRQAGHLYRRLPATEEREWRRTVAHLRGLERMLERVRALEQRLAETERGTMNAMDIKAVLEHLPHRYPFLLIDRVLECEPGKRIVALKNVTVNEPFFQGHSRATRSCRAC